VARFPFPPHGRIPNFAGAEVAAARLLDIEPWKSATALKVNPDSPHGAVAVRRHEHDARSLGEFLWDAAVPDQFTERAAILRAKLDGTRLPVHDDSESYFKKLGIHMFVAEH
jgi:hypothetical protein